MSESHAIRKVQAYSGDRSRSGENEGIVPEHAFQRYSFAQLKAHLENNLHDQKEFVSVAIRASIHLYRPCMDGFRDIGL
jgi:hypothetical protein